MIRAIVRFLRPLLLVLALLVLTSITKSRVLGCLWAAYVVVLWAPIILRATRITSWMRAATLAGLLVDGVAHGVVWVGGPWSHAHTLADWAFAAWLWFVGFNDPGDWLRRGRGRARALLTAVESARIARETREAFT